MIVNYDCTLITIVNYYCKSFIAQAPLVKSLIKRNGSLSQHSVHGLFYKTFDVDKLARFPSLSKICGQV
jgi:hypothetical protein